MPEKTNIFAPRKPAKRVEPEEPLHIMTFLKGKDKARFKALQRKTGESASSLARQAIVWAMDHGEAA